MLYHTIVINYGYLCLVKKEANMVTESPVEYHNNDYNCNAYHYSVRKADKWCVIVIFMVRLSVLDN